MKRLVYTILFFSFSTFTFAQESFTKLTNLVEEGIQYHDQGDYTNAIASYKQALGINPKSPLANYEISLTYFTKKDYKQAIKYANVVLSQKSKYMTEAYVTKGSSLDLMGKTDESIKLFKKAIKKGSNHYLIYYNLSLNYLKIGDNDHAEEYAMKAIEQNGNHATSHLVLATINESRGRKTQTMLASYYFLFLEPNSNRSAIAWGMLESSFGAQVTEKEGGGTNININLLMDADNEFSSTDMMVSLLSATRFIEENKDKTDDEMFVVNTKSFFSILGELRENEKKKSNSLWNTFYVDFFYKLAESEHLETFCKYITQSTNEDSQKWLSDNADKLDAFDAWLKE